MIVIVTKMIVANKTTIIKLSEPVPVLINFKVNWVSELEKLKALVINSFFL